MKTIFKLFSAFLFSITAVVLSLSFMSCYDYEDDPEELYSNIYVTFSNDIGEATGDDIYDTYDLIFEDNATITLANTRNNQQFINSYCKNNIVDEITITLFSRYDCGEENDCNNSVDVKLTETAIDSRTFVGTYSLVNGSPSDHNSNGENKLFSDVGNYVSLPSEYFLKDKIYYNLTINPYNYYRATAPNVISIDTDATKKVGESIAIELVDTSKKDKTEVSVTVTTDKGETETISIAATGNETGIFQGNIPTEYGATKGTDGDNKINTSANTVVTVTYNSETSNTTTMTGGTTGTISLSQNLEVGENISVTLNDADLNTNTTTAETVKITLSSNLQESEEITLTETSADSGIFEGTLSTSNSNSINGNNNGTIYATNGTVITAVYNDSFDAEGNTATSIEASTTMTMTVVSETFDEFKNTKVEVTKTISYFGTDVSSGVNQETDYTTSDYYCYGADYEIFNPNGNLEVYANISLDPTQPNHCSVGSELYFTNTWSENDGLITINDGINDTKWTYEKLSDSTFKMSTLQVGSFLIERYYQVVE